jgi:hypothetical protein
VSDASLRERRPKGEAKKKNVAGKQFFKCANKPDSKINKIKNYQCPLWQKNDDTKGCFDESGYEIDHIIEYSITNDDSLNNLQALCKMCHSVKTKRFMINDSKQIYGLIKIDNCPFIETDLDAQIKLFELEGENKFKYCEGDLYIFDEKTGMFRTNIETLFYYLIKNKDYLQKSTGRKRDGSYKISSYGTNRDLQRKIIPFIKVAAEDNYWPSKTENTRLGYLLFEDGIYNMKTGVFTSGFNSDIVFHARVPWNFPEKNEDEMKYTMDISFNNLFENPSLMISRISRALAGDISIKKLYFCIGNSNSGKSSLVFMLRSAFGEYIECLFETLTCNKIPKLIIEK